jgi:hypothetical protein
MRQFALRAGQTLVRNQGFETGDFSYWLLGGDNGTYNFVDNGSITGITPHSGSYCATMGQVGLPLATLSENVPTFSGQPYLLSFWLKNPNLGSGTTPNQFSVAWNGVTLLNKTNMATQSSWTNFQFLVGATNTSSALQFGFRNDNSAFGLDDVTVTSFPQPAFTKVLETNRVIKLTWSAVSNYNYQLQYATNLFQTNWAALGGTIKATNSTMNSTDSTTNNAQRFYRVVLIL